MPLSGFHHHCLPGHLSSLGTLSPLEYLGLPLEVSIFHGIGGCGFRRWQGPKLTVRFLRGCQECSRGSGVDPGCGFHRSSHSGTCWDGQTRSWFLVLPCWPYPPGRASRLRLLSSFP